MVAFLLPIVAGASAVGGGFAMHYLQKGAPYPQDLINSLGSELLLDKYISMKEANPNNQIFIDTESKMLVDLTAKKVFLSIDNPERVGDFHYGDKKPVLAEVPIDDFGPVFMRGTGIEEAKDMVMSHVSPLFNTKWNLLPPVAIYNLIFGEKVEQGQKIAGDTKLRVKYHMGTSEEKVTMINLTASSFQNNLSQAMTGYTSGVFASYKQTTLELEKIVGVGGYEALSEQEREQYAKAYQKNKSGVDCLLSTHIPHKDDDNPSYPIADKARAAKSKILADMPDGKKMFLAEKALASGAIDPLEMDLLNNVPEFQKFVANPEVKVDSSKAESALASLISKRDALRQHNTEGLDKAGSPLDFDITKPISMVCAGIAGLVTGQYADSGILKMLGTGVALAGGAAMAMNMYNGREPNTTATVAMEDLGLKPRNIVPKKGPDNLLALSN